MTNLKNDLYHAIITHDLLDLDEIIIENEININLQIDGESMLHLAVDYNDIHIIHYLVSAGCNVDALGANLDTPIQRALDYNMAEAALIMAKYGKDDRHAKIVDAINRNMPDLAMMLAHGDKITYEIGNTAYTTKTIYSCDDDEHHLYQHVEHDIFATDHLFKLR